MNEQQSLAAEIEIAMERHMCTDCNLVRALAEVMEAVQSRVDAWRERAEQAEAEVKRLTDLTSQYADRALENGQRAEQAEADLARSKDVAIREAEQVRSERNRYAEIARLTAAFEDERERARQAEEAEFTQENQAKRAEAELEQWRACFGETALKDARGVLAERDQLRAAAERVRERARAAIRSADDYAVPLSPARVVSVAANSIGYAIQQVCHLDLHVDAVTAAAQRLYDQGLLKTPAEQPRLINEEDPDDRA